MIAAPAKAHRSRACSSAAPPSASPSRSARPPSSSTRDSACARVYLDWNATTPPHPDVLEAMRAAPRTRGQTRPACTARASARAVIEDARALGQRADPVSTRATSCSRSGGTEANNLALRTLAHGTARSSRAASSTHRSRRWPRRSNANGKGSARPLAARPPDGVIDLDDLDARSRTARSRLVTVQAVNHETGVIQPVAETLARAHAASARVHVDAVQALGQGRRALGLGYGSRSARTSFADRRALARLRRAPASASIPCFSAGRRRGASAPERSMPRSPQASAWPPASRSTR